MTLKKMGLFINLIAPLIIIPQSHKIWTQKTASSANDLSCEHAHFIGVVIAGQTIPRPGIYQVITPGPISLSAGYICARYSGYLAKVKE